MLDGPIATEHPVPVADVPVEETLTPTSEIVPEITLESDIPQESHTPLISPNHDAVDQEEIVRREVQNMMNQARQQPVEPVSKQEQKTRKNRGIVDFFKRHKKLGFFLAPAVAALFALFGALKGNGGGGGQGN